MKLQTPEIKTLITTLGYQPQDGEKNIFWKSYTLHHGYIIKVNFDTQKIEYGSDIQLGDLTTSNFENSENFVVLECINRLLEKGYAPSALCLEHKWPMGRKEKGKLDILVLGEDTKAYLMIECKTWGNEFEKEKRKMLRDGGQLFSYYVQDKAAQYLCLYTSRLNNSEVEYANEIIKVDELWHSLDNQEEIFAHWNHSFKENGIFENWVSPYNIEIKALTRGQLKELNQDDSSFIYHRFLEILRHNVVSDKPNAFNKILNLFICKIIDEDKKSNEEVAFQWLDDDTPEKLQMRLNDLYKEGMQQFLGIEVTDYSDYQLDSKLYNVNDPDVRKQIQEMFIQLRLQKNPEFAFKEVYNDESFADNAVVVKEVVELLQPYQFRYVNKQQFLGDFFELLLNTSIKQEAGQYFTPVPIAKFVVSALPIKELIAKRLHEGSTTILPYAIDYAAGSGHFLTEWIDELQRIIDEYDVSELRPTAKKKFDKWQGGDFNWAAEYVYGIEADYRLVKTAKVSSFLNGDGEARIIRANGLDRFNKSRDYVGLLKEISKDDPQNNNRFDILIANPPYSVSAFKNTIQNGEESFELFSRLTDSSSEIECLFVERAKQLLRIGGWAGIILPSSILSNLGIYIPTRDILIKYFYIKAIVELGPNTFMATDNRTIILFLERRQDIDWRKADSAVQVFFEKPKDTTVLGIEKNFSKYVESAYENVSIDDYISFISHKPTEQIKNTEMYLEYKSWFNALPEVKQLYNKKQFKEMSLQEQNRELEMLFYNKVIEKEKDKILCYILTYSQSTTVIKVGEKQDEKDFLGYEFSDRRGSEGIKMYKDQEGHLLTNLYDEDGRLSAEKANYYIYNAFLNKRVDVSSCMESHVSYIPTTGLFDFSKPAFNKTMYLKPRIFLLESQYKQTKLKDLVITPIQRGKSVGYDGSVIRVIKSGQARGYFEIDLSQEYYVSDDTDVNDRLLCEGDLLINSSGVGTAGRVTLFNLSGLYTVDSHISIVRFDQNQVLPEYALYALASIGFKNIESLGTGQSGQIEISPEALGDIKIPLPGLPTQQEIIKTMQKIQKKEIEIKNQLLEQLHFLENAYINDTSTKSVHEMCEIVSEKFSPQNVAAHNVNYVGLENIEPSTGRLVGFSQSSTKHIKSEKNIFHKGDVLYGKLRPYLNKVWCAEFDGICSTDILVLKSDKPYALKHALLDSRFVAQTKNVTKGSHPRIKRAVCRLMRFGPRCELPRSSAWEAKMPGNAV